MEGNFDIYPKEEIRIDYCAICGAQIGAAGLCSYACALDARIGRRLIVFAFYKLDRTEIAPTELRV